MNKTQKGAWFNLFGVLLSLGFYIHLAVLIKSGVKTIEAVRIWSIVIIAFMLVSIIWIIKKQSPKEVAADERDNLIKKKAVTAAFVAICILLALASVVPQKILGEDGALPVYILPFVNLGIFLISLAIYSIAVLVQYGRGGKDGQ